MKVPENTNVYSLIGAKTKTKLHHRHAKLMGDPN